MTIKYRSIANYSAELARFLRVVEGHRSYVYIDSVGVPTISVGVAATGDDGHGGNWAPQILAALGVQTTDVGYSALLKDLIGVPAVGARNRLDVKFQADLASWASQNGRSIDLVNQLSPTGEAALISKVYQVDEDKVDALFSGIPQSKERTVLVSLAHNGIPIRNKDLGKGIRSGDRAMAWYAIRYEMSAYTNSKSHKIAYYYARRYAESEQFGLYDDQRNVSVADALDVYGQFSKPGLMQKALTYEGLYAGQYLNGMAPTQTLEQELTPALQALAKEYAKGIITDYRNVFVSATDHTGTISVQQTWKAAASPWLYIAQGNAETLVANNSVQSVLVSRGSDTTFRGGIQKTIEINDTSNSDTFYNGSGPTLMIGGSGADTFRVKAGSGPVVIYGGGGNDSIYLSGGKNICVHNIVSPGPVTNAWLEQFLQGQGGGAVDVYIINASKSESIYGDDGSGNFVKYGMASAVQTCDLTGHYQFFRGSPTDEWGKSQDEYISYALKSGSIWYSPDLIYNPEANSGYYNWDSPNLEYYTTNKGDGSSQFASAGFLDTRVGNTEITFDNFANGDLGIGISKDASQYAANSTGYHWSGDLHNGWDTVTNSSDQLASSDYFSFTPGAGGGVATSVASVQPSAAVSASNIWTNMAAPLLSGTGGDVFHYDIGDGSVEIDENDPSMSPHNALVLGPGIDPTQVLVEGDDDGNLILLFGGDAQVVLRSALKSGDGVTHGVQTVAFSDGTVWTATDLLAKSLTADPGKAALYGGTEADTIDTRGLVDTVSGGGGGDTFLFDRGYGYVSITEADSVANPHNRIQFGSDIAPGDVSVSADDSGSIYLTIGDADQIELVDALNSDASTTYGVQSIVFADGTVWNYADLLATALTPVEGAEGIFGDSSANLLDSGGLVDYAQGGGGGDTFVYNAGYGDLTIAETETGSAINMLSFGEGIDPSSISLMGTSDGEILLELSDGSVVTLVGALGDQSHVRSGVQRIAFADGTNWTYEDLLQRLLASTAGVAGIYGDAGSNLLDTKGLTDFASGGGGGDRFIYNQGYGDLTIDEEDDALAPNNVLVLGAGIQVSDVAVQGTEYGDLILTIDGSQITLTGALLANGNGVQTVVFADGTTWTRSDLVARALEPVQGEAALYGDAGANVFDSQGLVPTVNGGGGGDTFIYQRGYGALTINETDSSDSPDNALQFGSGIQPANLTVSGTSNGDILIDLGNGDVVTLTGALQSTDGAATGVQHIVFGDGTIWSSADLVHAAATAASGKIAIYGDLGANVLDTAGIVGMAVGNGGGDTFRYDMGYGHVVIDEEDVPGVANNVLSFGEGVSASAIAVSKTDAGDIVLSIDGTNDVTLKGALIDDPDVAYGVQSVTFADGTSWSIDQLRAYATGHFDFAPGAGDVSLDEAIVPTSGAPVIQFDATFTPQNLMVTANADGSISINDGDGDILSLYNIDASSAAAQTFQFSDGTVWTLADLLAHSDIASPDVRSLYGTGAAETFDGRGYAQLVVGGGGGDTIVYDAGYGLLVIDEEDNGANPSNKIQLGAGISASQVRVSGDDQGNLILDLGGSDRITLLGALNSTPDLTCGVQQIAFADGTTWSTADLIARAGSTAGGNTQLYGDHTANSFDPGGTADYISGGGGGDSIVYQRGYGAVTIAESDTARFPENTLVLGAGIAPDDLDIEQNGDDLVIDLGGGDVITLANAGTGDDGVNYGIQKIEFADGTVQYLPYTVYGSTGGETLDNHGHASEIVGYGGGDTILYNLGDGELGIDETGGESSTANVLRFGAGITAQQVSVSVDASGNLTFDLGNDDIVTIYAPLSMSDGGVGAIGSVQFADGTSWSYSDLVEMMRTPVAGGGAIVDGTAGNVLDPQGLVRTIYAQGGGDTIVYQENYGSLQLYETDIGNNPNNILQLGNGITPNDVVVSGYYGESIYLSISGGGNIYLYNEFDQTSSAKHGVQSVVFADGTIWTYADLLQHALHPAQSWVAATGDTNANLIDTGGHSHQINGNGGGDTIVYNLGYGDLSVNDFAPWGSSGTAANVISFGAGISTGDVTPMMDWGDLRLRMSDGSVITPDGITEFHFNDGTIWTLNSILQSLAIPSATNTTLWGQPNVAQVFDPKGIADTIQGQSGQDTIIYKTGYGAVTVIEPYFGDAQYSGTEIDLSGGISPNNVAVSYDGQMMHLFVGDGADSVSFNYGTVGKIRFDDGTVWTAQQLAELALVPSSFNTEIYGENPGATYDPKGIAHTVHGLGGGDTIYFNRGYGAVTIDDSDVTDQPNTLVFGAGITPQDVVGSWVSGDGEGDIDQWNVDSANLVLSFGGGDQVILLGAAQSASHITYGVDRIVFSDGTIWTYNDLMAWVNAPTAPTGALIGDLGANEFDPKGNSHQIIGQGGGDVIHYQRGYGALELDEANPDPTSVAPNVIQFGAGINPSDVTVIGTQDGSIQYSLGGGDVITIPNVLFDSESAFTLAKFADGTTWNHDDVIRLVDTGAPGKPEMYGTDLDETFDSRGYTDYINGGDGRDTYKFDRGYGSLTIDDFAWQWDSTLPNAIQFADDIAPSDVTVSDWGGDLILTLDGSDRIVVKNQYRYLGNYQDGGVQRVVFSDGTTWTNVDLYNMVTASGAGSPAVIDPSSTISGAIMLPVQVDGPITASGAISFTDPDVGDAHKISVVGDYFADGGGATLPTSAQLLTYFTASLNGDAGGDTPGNINWSFNAPSSAFDGLAPGTSVDLAFVIEIADENHAVTDQVVTIRVSASADGNPTTARITGTPNADIIDLPAQNFIADGGLGDDTFNALDPGSGTILFAKGDGHDELVNGDGNDANVRTDALRLTDIDPNEVDLARAGQALTINVAPTGDSFTADQQFGKYMGWYFTPEIGVSEIDFADGTVWDRAEIDNRVQAAEQTFDTTDETLDASSNNFSFVVGSGIGAADVTNFDTDSVTHDYIEVSRTQFSDWAHLLGATQQQGSDLVITLNASDSIRLSGVSLADFTQKDVKFAGAAA